MKIAVTVPSKTKLKRVPGTEFHFSIAETSTFVSITVKKFIYGYLRLAFALTSAISALISSKDIFAVPLLSAIRLAFSFRSDRSDRTEKKDRNWQYLKRAVCQ